MRKLVVGSLAVVVLAIGAGRADAGLIAESLVPLDVSPSILAVPAGGFTSPVDFSYRQGIVVRNPDPFTYLFTLTFGIVLESLPSGRDAPGGVFRDAGLFIPQSTNRNSIIQNYPLSFTIDAATLNAAVAPGDTQLHVFIGGVGVGAAIAIPEPPTLATGATGVLTGVGVAWRRRKRVKSRGRIPGLIGAGRG